MGLELRKGKDRWSSQLSFKGVERILTLGCPMKSLGILMEEGSAIAAYEGMKRWTTPQTI